jgi:hypothetical protein
MKRNFRPCAAVLHRPDDARDDVAAALDQDDVADADILAADLVLVVQSRPGNGCP